MRFASPILISALLFMLGMPLLEAPVFAGSTPNGRFIQIKKCVSRLKDIGGSWLGEKKSTRRKWIVRSAVVAGVFGGGLGVVSQIPMPIFRWTPFEVNLSLWEWLTNYSSHADYEKLDGVVSLESTYLLEIKASENPSLFGPLLKKTSDPRIVGLNHFNFEDSSASSEELSTSRRDYVRQTRESIKVTYPFHKNVQRNLRNSENLEAFFSNPQLDQVREIVEYSPDFKDRKLTHYLGFNGRLPKPLPRDLMEASKNRAQQSGIDPITTAIYRIDAAGAPIESPEAIKLGFAFAPAPAISIQALKPLLDSQEYAWIDRSEGMFSSDFPLLLLWNSDVYAMDDWPRWVDYMMLKSAYRERLEFLFKIDTEAFKRYQAWKTANRPTH